MDENEIKIEKIITKQIKNSYNIGYYYIFIYIISENNLNKFFINFNL